MDADSIQLRKTRTTRKVALPSFAVVPFIRNDTFEKRICYVRSCTPPSQRTAILLATSVCTIVVKATKNPDSLIVPGRGVGKIKAGMTKDGVIAALGQPDIKQEYNGQLIGSVFNYDYLGFIVVFDNRKIVHLVSCGDPSGLPNSPKVIAFTARTKKGIGMESSKEDIVKAYGRTCGSFPPHTQLPGRTTMICKKPGLEFTRVDNRVVHISVGLQLPK